MSFQVGLSPSFYGIKAYEEEWKAKLRKRNNRLIFSFLKKEIINVKVVVWILLGMLIHQATVYFDQPMLWKFFTFSALISFLLIYSYVYSWKDFNLKKLFVRKTVNGVHKSKETLLSKPHSFLVQVGMFINLFTLVLNVPNLFIDDYKISTNFGIAFSVLMMLLSYVFYEVVKKSIEEEKENSLIHQLDHSQFSNK